MFGSRRGSTALTVTASIFAVLFLGTSLYAYILWRDIGFIEQQMESANLDEFDRRAVEKGSFEEMTDNRELDPETGQLKMVFDYRPGSGEEEARNLQDLKDEIEDLQQKRHMLSNLLGFGYRTEGRTDYNLLAIVLNRLANLTKQGTDEPWFPDLAGKKSIPQPVDLSLSGQIGGEMEIKRDEETKKVQYMRRTLTLDPTNYDLQGKDPMEATIVWTNGDVQGIEVNYTVEKLIDRLSAAISGDDGLFRQVENELQVIRTKWGHPDDLVATKFGAGWEDLERVWPDGGDLQRPPSKMDPQMRNEYENRIRKEGYFGLESELRNNMIAAADKSTELNDLLAESISQNERKFDEIFGTWTYDTRRGFNRRTDGTLLEKEKELSRKMEEARKKRVVYLTRVEDYWRAKGRFDDEIGELRATLTNLRDPLAQRTPFEQYIAKIQAERRKRPEETALQKDGGIVYANTAQKIAYVDLNRADGVFPGMTFDVYHYRKGGIPEKKGEVRVKNVGEDLSLVVILEERFELNPIGEGDFVVNEVFDREKKKYFVFAGRIDGAYTNEQATRLIEELGHFVEPQVSAKTDYVIMGTNYPDDDNWIAAERLGIESLTQGDLLRWLGKER